MRAGYRNPLAPHSNSPLPMQSLPTRLYAEEVQDTSVSCHFAHREAKLSTPFLPFGLCQQSHFCGLEAINGLPLETEELKRSVCFLRISKTQDAT